MFRLLTNFWNERRFIAIHESHQVLRKLSFVVVIYYVIAPMCQSDGNGVDIFKFKHNR
jgi:hypothetical protein